METILITGGTGLVGRALTGILALQGYRVIIVSRKIPVLLPGPNIQYAVWDIKNQMFDKHAIEKCDYIVHLAGAPVVDKKWTKAYMDEIVNSRVNSSKLIVQSLNRHAHKVKAVISASAIGYYGKDKNRLHAFIETDAADTHFLGTTCRLWEESIDPVETLGIRLVKLRVGIVLSNDGGALTEFKKPIRFGIAAVLGSGKQVISWIHITDLCRMIIYAIENKNISGTYNATAPAPVTNKKLTLELAGNIKGKNYIPVHIPSFLLKTVLGQRSIEVLKSTTVSCEKIKQAGFNFLYPEIEKAVLELTGSTNQQK